MKYTFYSVLLTHLTSQGCNLLYGFLFSTFLMVSNCYFTYFCCMFAGWWRGVSCTGFRFFVFMFPVGSLGYSKCL